MAVGAARVKWLVRTAAAMVESGARRLLTGLPLGVAGARMAHAEVLRQALGGSLPLECSVPEGMMTVVWSERQKQPGVMLLSALLATTEAQSPAGQSALERQELVAQSQALAESNARQLPGRELSGLVWGGQARCAAVGL